ncbi:peptidase [Arthrobacter sp. UCD-GKA]|nr:peptidase [Arthrobacter sp. UCD-GKA]
MRSPSGRVPQWALDEAAGQEPYASVVPLKRPARSSFRRPRLRRPRRSWNLGVVIALLVGLYYSPVLLERHIMPALAPSVPGSNVPPRGVDAATEPLGTPPAATGSGSFRLQDSPDPGQDFVAYDPCRPVRYVIRTEGSPVGGETLIHQAVAEISAATGLRFIYDGSTTEAPTEQRKKYQPERYGKRWAPVLIAWSTPEETPDLAGDVAGLGGSAYAHVPGQPYVYVAGQVKLDAPALAPLLAHRQGPALLRAVIIHELGHVVGLGHIDDPGQLMHDDNVGTTALADGDRAGLALLGTGACVPQL